MRSRASCWGGGVEAGGGGVSCARTPRVKQMRSAVVRTGIIAISPKDFGTAKTFQTSRIGYNRFQSYAGTGTPTPSWAYGRDRDRGWGDCRGWNFSCAESRGTQPAVGA